MTLRKFIFTALIASLIPCISSAAGISEKRQKFISYALSFQGVPYVYGGTTPKGFDCSGFVGYASNHGIGYQLPRQAAAMYNATERISPAEREPGDLMFFKNNLNSDRITHVGIYCGVYHSSNGANPQFEGKRVFVSAVSDGPRTGVILTLIDERFWKNHFFAYGRFLPPSGADSKKTVAATEKKSAETENHSVQQKNTRSEEKVTSAKSSSSSEKTASSSKSNSTQTKNSSSKSGSQSGEKSSSAQKSSAQKSSSSKSGNSKSSSEKPKVTSTKSEDSVNKKNTTSAKKRKAPAKKPPVSSGKY